MPACHHEALWKPSTTNSLHVCVKQLQKYFQGDWIHWRPKNGQTHRLLTPPEICVINSPAGTSTSAEEPYLQCLCLCCIDSKRDRQIDTPRANITCYAIHCYRHQVHQLLMQIPREIFRRDVRYFGRKPTTSDNPEVSSISLKLNNSRSLQMNGHVYVFSCKCEEESTHLARTSMGSTWKLALSTAWAPASSARTSSDGDCTTRNTTLVMFQG
jgi:hypothetical protein